MCMLNDSENTDLAMYGQNIQHAVVFREVVMWPYFWGEEWHETWTWLWCVVVLSEEVGMVFFFFLKTQTCSTGCDWGITNHVSTHQLLTGTCDLTVETKSWERSSSSHHFLFKRWSTGGERKSVCLCDCVCVCACVCTCVCVCVRVSKCFWLMSVVLVDLPPFYSSLETLFLRLSLRLSSSSLSCLLHIYLQLCSVFHFLPAGFGVPVEVETRGQREFRVLPPPSTLLSHWTCCNAVDEKYQ